MRHISAATLALFALFADTPPVSAQASELQPGARVRVQAPGFVAGWFEGTILARSADTLVVGGPNANPVHVPFARISALEISRGSSRGDGAIRGMKWGVPIMAVFGVALAATGGEGGNCSTCDVDFSDGVKITALFALSGAFYGAGIGAIVGRERWDQFDLASRTALHVGRGRIGLAVGF
ncbi:MAG: hypothetical protein ABIT20_23850 [Gemmatimonadaceae bacterium]